MRLHHDDDHKQMLILCQLVQRYDPNIQKQALYMMAQW
jgi:hypothetical protein